MARKYRADKRGTYAVYERSSVDDAVAAVRGGMSLRKAAEKYKIPKSTINDRVKEKVPMDAKSGRKPYLPAEIENDIIKKATSSAAKGFGISKRQLLLKVGTLCKKTSVASFKNGIPGKDWWYSFVKRHPEVSLRKPEKLETNRACMLNKVVVDKYFKDLSEIITNLNLNQSPEFIWNADETGKQMGHNPVNVVALKGTKSVVSRTSNDRTNITIMACVNASGTAMPPMMIVKGKTTKFLYGYNTAESPPNTVWTHQERAWINDDIGSKWFTEVFLRHCGPHRPQLLILDGHGSHETLSILEKAEQENITILALPPHTTHFLQPLDRSVFGPFNKAYNRYCSEFLSDHPCNLVNKWTFPGLFSKAWVTAMTKQNIVNGFRGCGIYPLNKAAVPESAYLPSNAYETERAIAEPTEERA
jgi:transposase